MKKIFSLAILLMLTSCYGVCRVGTYTQQRAQSMYNALDTSIARDITPDQGYKLFGGCYTYGDYIYVYTTFWGKKYILVHRGEVITYADEEELKN